MPVALVIPLATAAIKVGVFALGSIIHEGSKLFGNDCNVATAKPLLFINDGQSPRLVEEGSSKATPSNAVIVYGSRSIIPSSSPRVLVSLGNQSLMTIFSQVESHIGKFASRIFGLVFRRQLMDISLISVDLKRFVDWYLDWKERICAFLVESVSESIVEKEAMISITTLIQVRISKAIATSKEATHLLIKSKQENALYNIVHERVPIESPIMVSHLDMVQVNHSVASNTAADGSKRRLSSITVFLATVKRILSMVFVGSLDGNLDPLRRGGSIRVCALICTMLFVSASIVGRNIPFTWDGGGYDDGQLNYEVNSLEIPELPSSIATPRLTSPWSHDFAYDVVFPSPRNLGSVPSLSMHSHEGPVDTKFDVDCHSLGLPSWLDGALWNDSVTQSDTEGETHSQMMWRTAVSSPLFEISPATSASSRERDGDEVIPYSMTAEQHVPAEIESFDPHAIIVRPVGLTICSNDKLSTDSHIPSHIEVQSHARFEAFVQIRITEPSYLTWYEDNHLFVFTVTRGYNEITSAIPTGQLALNEVEVYDEAAVVNLQYSWKDDVIFADNPSQPSVEVMNVYRIFWNAQPSPWALIGHGCHFILVLDLDGGASSSHQFESEEFALAVANEDDIYVAAINMGDNFSFNGIIQADSLVNVLVGCMAKRTLDYGRASNSLVIAASERPHEHSLIKYPFRGALSIAETSSGPRMRLIPVFDQLMPRIFFFLPNEAVSKDLAQIRMSLSTSLESHAYLKLGYSFEVIKVGISSRLLESSYLVWMLLLLLWNNCDPAEVEKVSDSKTPADFIAIESDTSKEWVVFEERQHIKKRKRLRTESNALHSDLGRHWKAPGKRRMRRSSRIRSKPKYFEPV